MKTRRGFVSNSSTTSFMIYGTKLEKEPADYPSPFEWYQQDDYYDGYFGISVQDMQMDETRRQFEERVGKQLAEVLTANGLKAAIGDFGMLSGGWYNG